MITELQTLKKNKVYYSDIPGSFSKSLISNDLSASYDLRAVQEALVGLIKTNKGERPFFPEFGCNVSGMLFENLTNVSAFSIKKEIETAISRFEPRVRVKNVVVQPLYDENRYHITIEYHLITDYDTLFQTKFKLKRGTNG